MALEQNVPRHPVNRTLSALNIYLRKKRWKLSLFFAAVAIVGASLWYTNTLVGKVAREERKNIRIWADAVQQKAKLVHVQEQLFASLQREERKRVELLARATQRLINASNTEDITFYSEIIAGNTTIPVILTDEEGNISSAKNVDFDPAEVKFLTPELKERFSEYKPIAFDYYAGNINYFYYADSKPFTEIKQILDELVQSFITDVVVNSASVPVIVTNEARTRVLATGNLDSLTVQDTLALQQAALEMAESNPPIIIDLGGQGKHLIHYRDSYVLTQLRIFPYIQFGVIGIFLLIAYVLFSTARKSEQNQVWAGLAKETAHQLGTPLSSLIGWTELLKIQKVDNAITEEIEKDIQRLDTIAQRFSKIGSPPNLEPQNLVGVIHEAIAYLKPRISKQVHIRIHSSPGQDIIMPLNRQLFEWVVENLTRNAVDAMEGKGSLTIDIREETRMVTIDFTDTGKGMPKKIFKSIFRPGYTSKKRGWGLGLSLASRIIRNYHKGKLFVKASAPGKGATFRIILRKS